jgi:hypothetical protein
VSCQTNYHDHDHYETFFIFPLYLGKLVSQINLRDDIIIFTPKFVIIAIIQEVRLPQLCVHDKFVTFCIGACSGGGDSTV